MRFGGIFDLADKQRRSDDLTRQAETEGFWDDNERAQRILREKGSLERVLRDHQRLVSLSDDVDTLIEMSEEAGGEAELLQEAAALVEELEQRLGSLEVQRLLSSDDDKRGAILEINPGAGGTDAADWAEMLLRMYRRWAERQGFAFELLDISPGEQAGIRGAAVAIRGEYAFGYLQAESGVHRLVRISPFDKDARRQTAFAAVSAYPEVDDTIQIDLNPADIEMDTMRASGAGGQHVNTTDSAVRLRHLPSGIVVLCRAERSQHKNRDKAMKMLRAKLYQRELDKRMESQNEARANMSKIDFGSQIRNYVLNPYQQVKDLRTELARNDVQVVLDGDISPFMEAWLAARASDSTTNA